MNRVCYADVLRGVAQLGGFDADALPLGEARRMRDSVSRRLEMGWEEEFWPELMLVEERRFALNYAAGTAYAAGNFVWHAGSESYFQALVATTGNAPATFAAGLWTVNAVYWVAAAFGVVSADDWVSTTVYARGDERRSAVDGETYVCFAATSTGEEPSATLGKWGKRVVMVRTIPYEQTGKTALGGVEYVKDRDPRNDARAMNLEFLLTAEGVTVTGYEADVGLAVPDSVWVRFRKRCPALFGETFSATGVYAALDQVFFGSDAAGSGAFRGDFFNCLALTTAGQSPSTTPSKWELVEIPRLLRRFLERGAAADYLRGEGEAQNYEGEALAELDRQVLLFRGEQQQERRTVVLGR